MDSKKYKQLIEMIGEAFDLGRVCPQELCQQTVEDIIAKYKFVALPEITVFSVVELTRFPVGTKFHHSLLGAAEIVTKKGIREPIMQFENGLTQRMAIDAFPWNVPMMLISKPSK